MRIEKYLITNAIDSTTAEILLYGAIGTGDKQISAMAFMQELKKLEAMYSTINVRINSVGGSVFEGIAIYNAIKQSKAVIDTYIDGIAASMASIISQAGRKRYISQSARVMTHKPSSGTYGSSSAMRKDAELLDGLELTMQNIYTLKTGKTADECKASFLNEKDNWFTATEAKAYGLVDEIYDADAVEIPAGMDDTTGMWNLYTEKFAAKFTNTNTDMKQTILSAAACAALGIDATAQIDAAAIDAKISELAAKAGKVDQLTAEVGTLKTTVDTLQKDAVTANVTAQLADALKEKRITAEQQTVFAAQFAEKPDELKAILAVMKPFTSVVAAAAAATGEATEEVKMLMAKTGDELFASDGFERLKAIHPEGYKLKYKEYFKEDAPAS